MSLDGKISTGVKEGLYQYYDREQEQSDFTLCTGKTLVKIGVNTKEPETKQIDCTQVIVDSSNISRQGVRYLCSKYREVIIYTDNPQHASGKICLYVSRKARLDKNISFS